MLKNERAYRIDLCRDPLHPRRYRLRGRRRRSLPRGRSPDARACARSRTVGQPPAVPVVLEPLSPAVRVCELEGVIDEACTLKA